MQIKFGVVMSFVTNELIVRHLFVLSAPVRLIEGRDEHDRMTYC